MCVCVSQLASHRSSYNQEVPSWSNYRFAGWWRHNRVIFFARQSAITRGRAVDNSRRSGNAATVTCRWTLHHPKNERCVNTSWICVWIDQSVPVALTISTLPPDVWALSDTSQSVKVVGGGVPRVSALQGPVLFKKQQLEVKCVIFEETVTWGGCVLDCSLFTPPPEPASELQQYLVHLLLYWFISRHRQSP